MELEHSTSGPYFADLTTDSLDLIATNRRRRDAVRSVTADGDAAQDSWRPLGQHPSVRLLAVFKPEV